MLITELLEIITNGENSGIEFKRDDIKPEQLAKEIVGFANHQGGRILLGVEDTGEMTGINRENIQEWVLNVFRDKVHPQIIPFYEEVKINDNCRIGVISVARGISKPYVVRHNNREDIYIRMGDRVELASREQQARLFEIGGMIHVESWPISGSTFGDMDKNKLEFYLSNILEDPIMPENEAQWIARLQDLGFMTEDGTGKTVCSLAGLLCFGIKPQRFLRQSYLRIMAFEGKDKEYKAIIDTTIDGSLIGRWQISNSGQRQLIDMGIFEKLALVIEPYITEESSEIDKNFRREKKWLYPWEAIRELVVNAFAHRDWTRTLEVELVIYSDRLEITSPGSLPNSMTVSKMIGGRRSPRNTIIMNVLRDYDYADSRGMGIRTKVIPLMESLNGITPIFKADEDYLKTILPRNKQNG